MNYFESVEGQFLYGANRYIFAAKCLRDSKHWKDDDAQTLHTPTLHLLCHGLELLFKVALIRGGSSEEAVRKKFGHDLYMLWMAPQNQKLRADAYSQAKIVWNEAASSGKWKNDDFSLDPVIVLEKAVRVLSSLHGPETRFALRYVVKDNMTAPRPKFLLEIFMFLAERRLMNPKLFD